MKALNQQMEWMDNYLLDNLGPQERAEFEKELDNDASLSELFTEQSVLVDGLRRTDLKYEIGNAQQTYQYLKWMKLGVVCITILTMVAILWALLENSKNPAPIQPDAPIEKSSDIPKPKQLLPTSSERDTIVKAVEVEVQDTTDTKNVSNLTSMTTMSYPPKSPERFKANSSVANAIDCQEGTELYVPANAFEDEMSGKPVVGEIVLEVTEFYKISEMLLAKLTTSTQEQPLETAGMIHIEATQNGRPLRLSKGKEIAINFARRESKEDYQIFEGLWQNEQIIWNLQEKADTLTAMTEEVIEVPYAVVEEVPTLSNCDQGSRAEKASCNTNAIRKHFQENFNLNVPRFENITGRQLVRILFKIGLNGEIQQFASDATNPRVGEEVERVLRLLPRFKPGKQRGKEVVVPYSLPLIYTIAADSSGIDLGGVNQPLALDTIYRKVRGKVEHIQEVLHDANFEVSPSLINKWREFEKQNLIRYFGEAPEKNVLIRKKLIEENPGVFKVLENDSITRGGHIVRKIWDSIQIPTTSTVMTVKPKAMFNAGKNRMDQETFEGELDGGESEVITSHNLSRYAFSTSALGWINCDRFINGKINRIPFAVKTENSIQEDLNLTMVFKDFNTILPSYLRGDRFVFGPVMADQEIILVGLKMQDGQSYVAMENRNTSEPQVINLQFEKVSSKQLKEKLSILDK